jgi:hypothetical protein
MVFSFLLKLSDEIEFACHEVANVFDAVLHHHEPVEPQTKGSPLPFSGVKPGGAQNVRMHQAAGQDFYPAGVFTHTAAIATAY